MPITPQEAFQTTEQESALLASWEKKIDAGIVEGCAKYGCARLGPLGSLTRKLREELIRRYQAAGWKVEYHDDQRDGESLTFRP